MIEVFEIPDPMPGPGEVSIDVTHAAVRLVDVFIRQGLNKDGQDVPGLTYLALTRVAHVQPGENVLVHGALGGLASNFPRVARSLGALLIVYASQSAGSPGQASYDLTVWFPTVMPSPRGLVLWTAG